MPNQSSSAAESGLAGYHVTSVTPIALRSDSRTLKQAASFAREGAKSFVIEGVASRRDFSRFDIFVTSLQNASPSKSASVETAVTVGSKPSFLRRMKPFLPGPAVEFAQFLLILLTLIKNEWWPLYRKLPSSDLYVLHAMNCWPAVWLKSKMMRRPYIYDAHDFYRGMSNATSADSFTRNWMLPLYAFLDRRAARNAAVVTTVSEGVAELYRTADGVEPVVIRNSHDLRADVLPPKSLREVVGVDSDQFLIVAVGNAKPGASIDKLIGILDGLDQSIHVAFVGKDFETLKGMDRAAGIASRVHFVDAVPPEEIVPFIRDADCSIIVYFAETDNYDAALPNRFFQSVAAELPLIYPRLKGMHNLAQAFQFGISFRPDDADEMRQAIRRVFDSKEMASELRTQARRASGSLAWEVEERALVSVAKEIIRSERK